MLPPDFIDDIDAFFFDMDGTIYLGEQPIPGAGAALQSLRERGKRCYFVTNNTSKPRQQYFDKLKRMEIEVDLSEIIYPMHGVCDYLRAQDIDRVALLGTEALRQTLVDDGFTVTFDNPQLVVIAYDNEMTYDKLAGCVRLIHAGVAYIATHPDVVVPSPDGDLPDVGLFLPLIESATGRPVDRVFGKPNADMITGVMARDGLRAERIAMVGDRLMTDIALAVAVKCHSILVLTGVTSVADLETSTVVPDIVLEGVRDLNVAISEAAIPLLAV
jgi:HAD superfamily hydrolase (TIGR01450 family)